MPLQLDGFITHASEGNGRMVSTCMTETSTVNKGKAAYFPIQDMIYMKE
jgi:hypothetical protein